MSNCSNINKINNVFKDKNEYFGDIFSVIFNTKIPNIFRKCYSESNELLFPTSFPIIFDDYNNSSIYKFYNPIIISDDNIKSIFYNGISTSNTKTISKLTNFNVINNNLKLLISNNNLNNFKYYITNKYSENSLLIQYLELTSIIFENYNYNIISKTTCHYIIDWEYTSGCTILGEIIKNYINYWNSNQLLILHYFITNLLSDGLDNYKILSTNLVNFMGIFKNFFSVMKDISNEFNFNFNNLYYCVPNYYKDEEILKLYKNYYKNSELSIVEKLNSNFTTIDIYCYDINITHYLELDNDDNINNQLSLDGSANQSYTLDNNFTVDPSIIHKYFFERSKNKDDLDQLDYRLENITDISEFPLFYYDNNFSNDYNSKYSYNKTISNYFVNGNKKIFNKDDLNIIEQFIFNYYYYTSILVIIDKNKFGEITPYDDILNTTEFGMSLIDNFQNFYENGIIKIKSNNNDKTFQLDSDDLTYENNVVLCFIIPNDNIISINNINKKIMSHS